jgi:hypothetical protein
VPRRVTGNSGEKHQGHFLPCGSLQAFKPVQFTSRVWAQVGPLLVYLKPNKPCVTSLLPAPLLYLVCTWSSYPT